MPTLSSSVAYEPFISPQGFVLGQYRPNGVVLVGTFFVCIAGAASTLLIIIHREWRSDKRWRMNIWVRRYVFALVAQAVCVSVIPWLFVSCSSLGFRLLYAPLVLCQRLCFIAQTLFLMRISLVRLRIIGSAKARRRGRILLLVNLSLALVAALLYLLCMLTSGTVQIVTWATCAGVVACSVLVYIAFQINTMTALVRAVLYARRQAIRGHGTASVVRGGRTIGALCFVSAFSTGCWIYGLALDMVLRTGWTHFFMELVCVVDIFSGCLLALCCAGYVGPLDGTTVLQELHTMLEEHRKEKILRAMKRAARAVSGPACTLAALFEGKPEEDILGHAINKFRCVTWDVLKANPYLVTDGHSLDGEVGQNDYYRLSMPCRLAECDAFWSHSWHDDGEQKWQALSSWCEEFREQHGRAPKLWFDKVCIDQTDIQTDLQCLPIFLAGCNNLLITSGTTYCTRLWCCTELFVYMSMLNDDETRGNPVLLILGDSEEERTRVEQDWLEFDITRCDCFNAADKKRILSVIDRLCGADGFNNLIRGYSQSMSRNPDSVSTRSFEAKRSNERGQLVLLGSRESVATSSGEFSPSAEGQNNVIRACSLSMICNPGSFSMRSYQAKRSDGKGNLVAPMVSEGSAAAPSNEFCLGRRVGTARSVVPGDASSIGTTASHADMEDGDTMDHVVLRINEPPGQAYRAVICV